MNKKGLLELREEKLNRMNEITTLADVETRAMTEEETAEFDSLEKEIRAIDETLRRIDAQRQIPAGSGSKTTTEEQEERAFADFINGRIQEMRGGEQNVDWSNNSGAIIPTSIANRVIRAIKERCPILAGATIYNVKGTLKIPVWGDANSNHNINVGYATELSELTADAGKFTSVDLGGYLIGALTLIGKMVINSAGIDVVSFIVDEMADRMALFIEHELLVGSGSSAIQGATKTSNGVTGTAATYLVADDLIALQGKVKQVYQANSCWTMAPATFTLVKQLKDEEGRYLLSWDNSLEFPYRLLGKPVYLSDNMPAVAASAKAILYGDYSGMAVNFRENISIEVLREKYATQHAIGIVGFAELDAKVADTDKLAVLTLAASDPS